MPKTFRYYKGTHEGGLKTAETVKKRFGEDHYKSIGHKGGIACGRKGFAAMPKEKVQAAGRKGGKSSTRRGIGNGEGKHPRRKRPADTRTL